VCGGVGGGGLKREGGWWDLTCNVASDVLCLSACVSGRGWSQSECGISVRISENLQQLRHTQHVGIRHGQRTIELFMCAAVCVDVFTGGYVVFVCRLFSVSFSLSKYLSLFVCVHVCENVGYLFRWCKSVTVGCH